MARRKQTRLEQQTRIGRILDALASAYPDAACALLHGNALELLIATILSAQCTDERVNLVTRGLFRKYRGAMDYVSVDPGELENDIRTTGFFRNKAKSIQGACRMILEEFEGKVPGTMDELLRLPGVARKTANVVLGVAFGRAEGIVVDTHVFRLSHRLELASAPTPEKVESELMGTVPRERWISFSHELIHHGRRVCRARKPDCPACPLERLCRSKDKALALPLFHG
jgi:endonuclease-3